MAFLRFHGLTRRRVVTQGGYKIKRADDPQGRVVLSVHNKNNQLLARVKLSKDDWNKLTRK